MDDKEIAAEKGRRRSLHDRRFIASAAVLAVVVLVLALFAVWQAGKQAGQTTQENSGSMRLPIEDDMSFEFNLTGDERHELEVSEGDIITVTFKLYRTDQDAGYKLYALQNEIRFDGTAFELVEGSIDSAYTTSFHEMEDGSCRLFINTFSPTPEGIDLTQGAVFGSFQLKVLSGNGEYEISSENYEMSTKNGEKLYVAAANDLKITVSQP